MTKQDQPNRLAPLEPFLSDPEIVEILVDGPNKVYVEKGGELVDVPSPFRDEAHLMDVVAAILEPMGRKVDESSPICDARLFDGSRVNVVIPPISLLGPALTIRKFSMRPLTVEDLLGFGSWSEEMVEFVRACVQARLNLTVSGGTGSGKTTVLNLIAGMIPPDERIVTVENASELRLSDAFTRLVRLETRPPNLEGKGEVSMRDLVINALRMRPDRLLIGEVRGGEAIDIFQAMNTGHDGTMFSIHANGPRDVLARLEAMVLMANPSLPLLNIRQQMASAINLITHQERLQDGKRKLLKVTEVVGMQGDIILLQDIFEFRQTGMKNGEVTGHFTATGNIPRCLDRIRMAGVDLPMSFFTPS